MRRETFNTLEKLKSKLHDKCNKEIDLKKSAQSMGWGHNAYEHAIKQNTLEMVIAMIEEMEDNDD